MPLTAHTLALAAMQCRPGAPRLGHDELAGHLANLPGWSFAAAAIAKTFSFRQYHETLAFVNAVAFIAQREDHHPEMTFGFRECTVTFSTHDAGGVSLNDVICAAKVERLSA